MIEVLHLEAQTSARTMVIKGSVGLSRKAWPTALVMMLKVTIDHVLPFWGFCDMAAEVVGRRHELEWIYV